MSQLWNICNKEICPLYSHLELLEFVCLCLLSEVFKYALETCRKCALFALTFVFFILYVFGIFMTAPFVLPIPLFKWPRLIAKGQCSWSYILWLWIITVLLMAKNFLEFHRIKYFNFRRLWFLKCFFEKCSVCFGFVLLLKSTETYINVTVVQNCHARSRTLCGSSLVICVCGWNNFKQSNCS